MLQQRRSASDKKTAASTKTAETAKKPQTFYDVDTLGVPVPPVMVVSASLVFMGVVFFLHAISKIMA